MKIRIKNLIIGIIIGIAFVMCSFFLQNVYYKISLKHKIKEEIRNELPKIQQERMEKLRKQLKYNQRKC